MVNHEIETSQKEERVIAQDALRPRADYHWWQTITTRWSDNDAYGHVNNAVYYQWFDTTVNNWLINAGLLDVANGNPIGLVVATQCRYARSITYPEPVEIGLSVSRLGSSSVTYRLGAFVTGNDGAAAEASFTHVYVDRNSHRPKELPSAWRLQMESLGCP